MIPMPKTFTKNGFDFQLLHRQGNVAMLRKSKQGMTRLIESWEVVNIQKHDAWVCQGKDIPAKELLPSDEQWGREGWTYLTREEARKAFLERCPDSPE